MKEARKENSVIEDWILKRLEDNCITAVGTCCRKDGHHERQTYTRVIRKISLLQEYVFEIVELRI